MPIIKSPVVPPPQPPVLLPFPEIGFASATWYDPSGTAWPLTDTDSSRGYFTLAAGVSGLDAAPIEFTTDDHPRGGARVRHIQPQPRTIVWPLHAFGETHMEFVTRWRSLVRAFTDTKRQGPGILEIARPDGTRRQTQAYYQTGFDGQGQQGTGITSDSAVITLYCEDPYWYDPDPVTIHRENGGGSEDFFEPFPSITSSLVLGDTVAHNPGDEVAWPEWTITGPSGGITATNHVTDEEFSLDPSDPNIGHGSLIAGEQIFITTEPPSVRFENGDNWIGGLDWPSAVLWGLQPGDNAVTFTLGGASSGSAVTLTFYPRYESA